MQVTIVVPVYNRAELVVDALNSLRSQTHRPIEVIIVNDGSTDDSEEVARQWRDENEAHDFRVKVISQHNSGAPVARNRGLQVASSDFIAFLDSDDLYHPQSIEALLLGIVSNPEVDFAICETQDFISTPEKLFDYDLSCIEWSLTPLVFAKEYWQTAGAIYRRSRLTEAGGWNLKLRYGWQDRELCLRLQLLGFRYVTCALPLVWYRTNSTIKISDIARSKDDRFFVGIATAARSLAGIAIKRGRINEAAWLLSRYAKWTISAIYHQYIKRD